MTAPLIPGFDLSITSTPVVVKPRKLKMSWSNTAAQDLQDLWGGWDRWPRLPANDLDRVRDALEDPNYDPESNETYKGLWRWEDGRIATPDEVLASRPELSLLEKASVEMMAAVDREIIEELALGPVPQSAHLVNILNTIELSPCPRWCKDAARKIFVNADLD